MIGEPKRDPITGPPAPINDHQPMALTRSWAEDHVDQCPDAVPSRRPGRIEGAREQQHVDVVRQGGENRRDHRPARPKSRAADDRRCPGLPKIAPRAVGEQGSTMVQVSTVTLVWNCVATVAARRMNTVKVKFSARVPRARAQDHPLIATILRRAPGRAGAQQHPVRSLPASLPNVPKAALAGSVRAFSRPSGSSRSRCAGGAAVDHLSSVGIVERFGHFPAVVLLKGLGHRPIWNLRTVPP